MTGVDSKATEINVPKSVTVLSQEIAITGVSADAFKGNTTITSVTFADDSQITSIPDECFMGCTGLNSVSLPSSVSKIGNKAFYGCTNLNFSLPNGLEEIGDYAFKNCKADKYQVTIPAKVSHIGEGAFYGVANLRHFYIDEANTVLKELPDYCLYGCDIYVLRLTDNVEKIGNNFLTTSIKTRICYPNSGELVLPRNLKEIGENAFPLISEALYRIVFRGDVLPKIAANSFSDGVFANSQVVFTEGGYGQYSSSTNWQKFKNVGKEYVDGNITYALNPVDKTASLIAYPKGDMDELKLPETVAGEYKLKTVGAYSFMQNKIGNLWIPKTVSSVNKAFSEHFISVDNVYFEAGSEVKSIGNDFRKINNHITLPDHLETIEDNAFIDNVFESIVIPASVKEIGDRALPYRKVYFMGKKPAKMGYNFYSENSACYVFPANKESFGDRLDEVYVSDSWTLAFTDGDGLEYTLAPASDAVKYNVTSMNLADEHKTDIVVPSTVSLYGVESLPMTKLPNNTFKGSDLTSVKIGEGFETLGSSSFNGSKSLASVTLPESLKTIGDSCFMDCSQLASVTLPANVSTLGSQTFSGCSSLETVKFLGNGIKELPYLCFADAGIKSIQVPKGVETLGLYCFEYCKSLESVTLPDGLKTVEGSFRGCESLTSVTLPATVSTLGSSTFQQCSSLESVVFLGNGIKELPWRCFEHSGIKSIKIPESVTTLGEQCFSENYSLTSVNIPQNVTKISKRAFSSCTSLSEVTISEGLDSIETRAFSNCTSLKSITLPNSLSYILMAFEKCPQLRRIEMLGDVPEVFNVVADDEVYNNAELIVKKSYYENYLKSSAWTKFKNFPNPYIVYFDDNGKLDNDTYKAGYAHYERSLDVPVDYITLCLPYDIQLSDVEGFDEVYVPSGLALYKGTDLLVLLDKKDIATDVVAARTPMFIKKTSGVESTVIVNHNEFTVDDNTYVNDEPAKLKVYDWDGTSGLMKQNTSIDVRFGGTVSSIPAIDNALTLGSGGVFGKSSSISAYRSYLTLASNAVQKVGKVSIGIDGETTGIEGLVSVGSSAGNNYVYTVNGTLVNTTGETAGLAKGVYIINNKKIVVK